MTGPSIPNLLSLRGARGGARGNRRGPGRGPGREASRSKDAVILDTDNDAAVSRLSAVDVGYLDDPYARYFVRALDGPPPRRLPIINRGTYTRTTALNHLIDSFLRSQSDPSSAKQIVSLGAGTDTRALHLFNGEHGANLVYHEIDFVATSDNKFRTVQGVPLLAKIIQNPSRIDDRSWSGGAASGGKYFCHGLDLRKLNDPASEIFPGLQTDLPTLIISECCLCYMSPTDASQILAFFTGKIPAVSTIIYEPIRPHDPFGQVMVSNLASRNISMPTLTEYPEQTDQIQRLRDAGFPVARGMTIESIWDEWITPEEKERLDRLEGLDEVEEWKLLAAHYIVIWGSSSEGTGLWRSS